MTYAYFVQPAPGVGSAVQFNPAAPAPFSQSDRTVAALKAGVALAAGVSPPRARYGLRLIFDPCARLWR